MEMENEMARLGPRTPENVAKLGHPSGFTCPDCNGPLWEMKDKKVLRYRYRARHAYTAENMLSEKTEALETALWVALNTLEEGAQMSRKLADEFRARGHEQAAVRFEERARRPSKQAALIRQVLANRPAETAYSDQQKP